MSNIVKIIFFKLSYNPFLIKIAKRVFVYLPSLKDKLVQLRDGGSFCTTSRVFCNSDLLKKIKEDVLKAKKEV